MMNQSRLLNRNGNHVLVRVPEPIPTELAAYPFPKEIAKLIAEADKAWAKMDQAEMAWEQERNALEVAGETDKQTLIAAVRAGEGDPGTPAQDRAARAEEVAWVALEVAREDSKPPHKAAHAAIAAYVTEHDTDLASFELEQVAKAEAAVEAAQQAVAAATKALRTVGVVYTDAHQIADGRFDGSQLMLGAHDKNTGRDLARVRARYEALRDGQPDPTTTLTAGFHQPPAVLRKATA